MSRETRREQVRLTHPEKQLTYDEFYKKIIPICCGCGACILVCPMSALSYLDERPVLVSKCTDCRVCMKACPRFEPPYEEIEEKLFGRTRNSSEVFGTYRRIVVARTTDPEILRVCQDGGVVSTILSWTLDKGLVDGAVVSDFDRATLRPIPRIVYTKKELLKASGTRYTYSPNILSLKDWTKMTDSKLAFVGIPDQVFAIRKMQFYRLKKSEPIKLVIGLMCHESYTYEGLVGEIIEKDQGVRLENVSKINIKGALYIDLKDGSRRKISLKQARPFVREACNFCGDFSSEYADISAGGVGAEGWTVTILRSEYGETIFNQAVGDGAIETRSIEEFSTSLRLLERLAQIQRRRRDSIPPSLQ